MQHNLSDAQWCFLDLLMRAREKGVDRINRLELLNSQNVPERARLQLTFAALIMPRELVRMIGQHDFKITDEGVALYNLRFGNGGNPRPTEVADHVICLPGPDGFQKPVN